MYIYVIYISGFVEVLENHIEKILGFKLKVYIHIQSHQLRCICSSDGFKCDSSDILYRLCQY